jgi:hypothetical protein
LITGGTTTAESANMTASPKLTYTYSVS